MQITDRLSEMQRNYNTDTQQNRAMTEEQFDRIVEAIATGKYSWACLLILRFAGYNPLHYIPYRTYNRLMKRQLEEGKLPAITNASARRSDSFKKFQDLPYLEEIDCQSKQIIGGRFANLDSLFKFTLDR